MNPETHLNLISTKQLHMLYNHQNTKSVIVTFGPTISSFLMMTKYISYLKEMKGKSFEKTAPQVMLNYQVQDINKLYDYYDNV